MTDLFGDLLIFGEGGGDGGAGAAPGAAPAGQAADQTGVTAPVPGEQRRLTKAERRARLEQTLQAEQAQAQASRQPQQEAPQEAKRPFEELIKGEYKEDYGRAVQAAIQSRFKGVKDTETRAARAEGLLSKLIAERYDIKPGEDGKLDLDAVQAAMDDDDSLYEGLAAELGTSTEFARKFAKQQEQIEAAERERKEQERYAYYMHVRNAAEEAKKAYPDLDVTETAADPRFARLLEVLSPQAAYHALHQVELTTGAMQYAVDNTRAGIAASIQAGQMRPSEAGLGRQAPATTTRLDINPREMTREQRAALKRRAARGEEVYL